MVLEIFLHELYAGVKRLLARKISWVLACACKEAQPWRDNHVSTLSHERLLT